MWKKYYIYKEQISYDGGQTWEDTGNQTISGDPIGEYATEEECEGTTPPVPPTGSVRFYASSIDNVTHEPLPCDITVNGVTYQNVSETPEILMEVGTIAEVEYSDKPGYMIICKKEIEIPDVQVYSHVAGYQKIYSPYFPCNLFFDTCLSKGAGASGIINKANVSGYSDSTIEIDIGSGCTKIEANAFAGFNKLHNITCLFSTTPPTLESNAFGSSTCPIYVPVSKVNTFKTAWSQYASRIVGVSGY